MGYIAPQMGSQRIRRGCTANVPNPATVGAAGTCFLCIICSVAGDVVRQAAGLTQLGHFYVQIGGVSGSFLPTPRRS